MPEAQCGFSRVNDVSKDMANQGQRFVEASHIPRGRKYAIKCVDPRTVMDSEGKVIRGQNCISNGARVAQNVPPLACKAFHN